MAQVAIKQAMELTGKSDSTLRRDMWAGKVYYHRKFGPLSKPRLYVRFNRQRYRDSDHRNRQNL